MSKLIAIIASILLIMCMTSEHNCGVSNQNEPIQYNGQ